MQKRAVAVSAAAAVLGLAAAVLGFAAEYFKHKAFVGYDTFRCEYRRTPAFGCGIVAALLSLAAVALVTAASGCFGRFGAAAAAAAPARSTVRKVCAALAWFLVAAAATTFVYGAARNAGGTGGFTAVERRPGRSSDGGRDLDFVCTELRDGVFVSASIAAAAGIACAIAAYVGQRDQTATLGVAMGQPQWSAAQPPYQAPVAYPPYGGGYSAKQPAGTA